MLIITQGISTSNLEKRDRALTRFCQRLHAHYHQLIALLCGAEIRGFRLRCGSLRLELFQEPIFALKYMGFERLFYV
jgi:hypothetical protein